MDTLLVGDSTNEGKEWNAIIKLLEVEVLDLQLSLGSDMIWGDGIHSLESILDWDTIWESEPIWFRVKDVSK